jgi:Protein of unknown function (DUF2550)
LVPWWHALLDSFGSILALLALVFGSLFARRRWLSRGGGTFECSVRITPRGRPGPPRSARGWMIGLGRYAGDNLEWFRTFSFSPRPRHVFSRSMRVLGRRTPHGAEAFSLYAGHVVTDVVVDGEDRVELAMSERALTGFLAWTEAAPPGHDRLLA